MILLTLNLEFESLKPSQTMTSPSNKLKVGTSERLSFILKTLDDSSTPRFSRPTESGANLVSSVERLVTRPTIRMQSWVGSPNSSKASVLHWALRTFSSSSKCSYIMAVLYWDVKFRKSKGWTS